ncbi:AfsR/SARP family transcriptional regulator [Dactylosporangium fulvum]|uniref:Winged helix-turn-helix domain-containing protein n=1 Tax=Dactylosporangium fulvum TaxID=53359 RepID=A0ABY5W7L1_9ACTN|nr:AfsR/SARP family transcriptional regulator [Dactylosporangium fulvum]UWP86092.1 winged helix-turn-helix domain-containing protein [Dactylosporangium fulvum]
MRTNILGPFEVFQNDDRVVPSAPKLRQVFALLAVHANSVVRNDQLIEELWEDRPPLSATTTLQTYVYQLRKLHRLGGRPGAASGDTGEPPLLRTSPSGYMLTLEPDALDANRFARLSDQGRAQADAGEWDRTAETLRDALRMWRGPAFSDVGVGPVLHATAIWLEELRKSVVEQRITADLALGRHHELIGELTGLVAHEPINEGFQAKLILALYRSGRRSDALRAYQRAREALSDELGLEPSPQLQALHRSVLAADPKLDPPQQSAIVVTGPPPGRSPNQLPPDVSNTIERSAELTMAQQAVARTAGLATPVIVAVGAPGSGKSTFCLHFAHRIRRDYPDGQLFAELTRPDGTPMSPFTVLENFLLAIGGPDAEIPASMEDRVSTYRKWTDDRKALVVLDDAVGWDQIRPLLPTGEACAAVISSTRRLVHPSITKIVTVPSLSPSGGLRLLMSVLGRRRIARDTEGARELVDLCDGLPRALRTSAMVLEMRPHWSFGRLVSCLRGELPRPRNLLSDGFGLYPSTCRTLRLLPPATQHAFPRLAALQQPVSASVAASELGVDEDQAELMLEELVDHHLAEVVDTAGGGAFDQFRYRFRRPLIEVAGMLARRAPQHDDLDEHQFGLSVSIRP